MAESHEEGKDNNNNNKKKKSRSFMNAKQEKTFLNETFSFKASKENNNRSNNMHCNNSNKKNMSIFDKRNSYKEREQGNKANTSVVTRGKAQSMVP